MLFEKYLSHKKAIVITLDDALFPKKDYLLQVYYLFAEFIEYSEQIDSKLILDFMQHEYMAQGEIEIFEKTAMKYNIPQKYKENFSLLHETARLPLKLLLYKQVLLLLQTAVENEIQIFLLVDQNPAIAINKIKQVEWNGLEQYLTVYFAADYDNSAINTLNELLKVEGFEKEAVVLFASKIQFESNFVNNEVVNFSISEIL